MSSTSRVLLGLAKTAIATTFGGPIVGGKELVTHSVDLVAGWLGKESATTYESVLSSVELGLRQLILAERVADDQLEQGVALANDILAARGLQAAEIVDRDLDAAAVARTVLSRAAMELGQLDESAQGLCRRAITSVYSNLLSSPQALPELQRAFQRAVLRRLTELRSLPSEVVTTLQGVLAAAALVDHALQWRPDLYPPSALLRPEFGIVPFYGRQDALADLESWARSDAAVGVRLYAGAGGMGKTRLLIEACRRLAAGGWRAGFLNREPAAIGWTLPLDAVFADGRRLLIVIDYAETRASETAAVLRRIQARPAAEPVRVVLLARSVSDWWDKLTAEGDGIGDILVGPATSILPLQPLVSDPSKRRELFDHAARAFKGYVPRSTVAVAPSLADSCYDRVLYVLIAALAAVQGEPLATEKDLLDWALKRERRFLDDGVVAMGCSHLQGPPILQCAALATLADRARDRRAAIRLFRHAPLLDGETPAVIAKVAELLHRLYPGQAWLQGVLPDLLGEHLIEQADDEDVRLFRAIF
jgi:hypothetical protein